MDLKKSKIFQDEVNRQSEREEKKCLLDSYVLNLYLLTMSQCKVENVSKVSSLAKLKRAPYDSTA